MMRTVDKEELRQIFDQPTDLVLDKVLDALDGHCLRFLALSPFLLMSTQGANGADVSPKGDPAGFVKIIDQKTILIPDRPGNNRLDTMENILENDQIGCLFLIPGIREILRINGSADIVVGPELEALAHAGRVPKVAIRVRIKEVFFHCAKAIIRSQIWDSSTFKTRDDFPPLGAVLADQIVGLNKQEMIEWIIKADKATLY